MELRGYLPPSGNGPPSSSGERVDQRLAVLVGDVPGGEVVHLPVVDGTRLQRMAQSLRAELDAHGRGFERRPAGVDLERVVAEQAERGDVAGRRQRRRHVVRAADHALAADAVHVRHVGGLQRRLAAERLACGSSAQPSGMTMAYFIALRWLDHSPTG